MYRKDFYLQWFQFLEKGKGQFSIEVGCMVVIEETISSLIQPSHYQLHILSFKSNPSLPERNMTIP